LTECIHIPLGEEEEVFFFFCSEFNRFSYKKIVIVIVWITFVMFKLSFLHVNITFTRLISGSFIWRSHLKKKHILYFHVHHKCI